MCYGILHKQTIWMDVLRILRTISVFTLLCAFLVGATHSVFAAPYGSGKYGEGVYNEGSTPSTSGSGSSSGSDSNSSSSSKPSRCTASVPVGVPDFFQVNRTRTEATLYFTPVNDHTQQYHIVYGLWEGDERFGSLSHQVSRDTNNGVQSVTISHLHPKTEYWFKVAPVNGCAVGDWSNWLKVGKWINRESIFYKYFRLPF